MTATAFRTVEASGLPEYPLDGSEQLDSHWFIPWQRRRWLNSDMRLKGTPECRALYFDLINVAFDQTPIGTLPRDMAILSKLAHVDRGHFEALCRLDYGPLHRWEPCRCGDEVRLMHPRVLKTLVESIARKEDNRARTEAANASKRLQRLRTTIAGYSLELSKHDAAIRWMDEWLIDQGCGYRGGRWIERAIVAWNEHSRGLRGRR